MPIETLIGVGPELALLMNGALLVERMGRAGLPMCRPTILPLDERVSVVDEGYDVSLALRLYRRRARRMLGPDRWRDGRHGRHRHERHHVRRCGGRVWILTGRPGRQDDVYPGRGPGARAVPGRLWPGPLGRLIPSTPSTPISRAASRYIPGMGRLDEEAERLAGIFQRATPSSLVLLNETLPGPPREAEALARDAVRASGSWVPAPSTSRTCTTWLCASTS